jgi:hypothetical protein
LVIQAEQGETEAGTMARVMVGPFLRHGIVASAVTDKMMGKLPGEPRFDDFSRDIQAKAAITGAGDLSLASEMLTAQALSLDAIFTEMSRRAAINMGDYLNASERYARLAFKAQANCRATLEALAKLHQPREQTVRHVHVNDGGQAIVADEFHQHQHGGSENDKTVKQSDATGAAGYCAALPSPDPHGNGVPISSSARETSLQDARRD